ncbi:hypothetical protein CCR85_11760 [Rhodothalassium salexigens]|uniref:DUF2333 family protein n=1 Tax=Rhodothalassium salexigens TaxID=1086 RepID=UPI0019115744|nr:DUF2333 family protein [Rhodothalassium salexigens]MBK5912164.1 hypothetical protein [Rhodothalassium salexigens]MBK5921844.1 hypothetical protein [Rhodothalassium salexigens]
MADTPSSRFPSSPGRTRRLAGSAGGVLGWLKRRIAAAYHGLAALLTGLSARTWAVILVALAGLLAAYYVIGMLIVHHVDDDVSFSPGAPPEGGSRAVAMTAALIERELDHGWVKNDPFFFPSSLLDNMPNFQSGVFDALARFSFELRDQLGRNRGSSAADDDLEVAAGNLSKEGNAWIMQLPSLLPQTPSEVYFRRAIDGLRSYNRRLAAGDAIYDKRTDNFLQTLDRIALDLGSSAAVLDNFIEERAGGLGVDYRSDDLFFRTKGKLYGYVMVLRALRSDFASVIEQSELTPIYDEMVRSMERAARLDPWLMVMNGQTDGTLFPNHLSAQGFHLLRARTKLRELTNILAQ